MPEMWHDRHSHPWGREKGAGAQARWVGMVGSSKEMLQQNLLGIRPPKLGVGKVPGNTGMGWGLGSARGTNWPCLGAKCGE